MSQLALWAPISAPLPEGSRGPRGDHPSGGAELAAAAAVIRRYVWRGVTPPSPDRRPWTMARELHIWRRLVLSGWSPAELNSALKMLRTVRPSACRLTYLTRLDGPGLLADAAQAWRALEASAEVRPTRETVTSIRDILAGLGVA